MSNNSTSRRHFLYGGFAATGALGLAAGLAHGEDDSFAGSVTIPTQPIRPDDEAAWKAIARNYNVTSKITNLENGYWGIMARPVLAEYQRLTEFVNRENTYFARLQFGDAYKAVRAKVAAFLNVGVDEIALTRGATEALQALIGGYNKLKSGDTVLFADLDYSEMKTAMRWLEERRGVKAVKLIFPEPSKDVPLTEASILSFYEKALNANPRTKLLLLTHLNNWTGLIIPVAKIAKMARERGIDVVLDAAHSVGQVDMQIKDLGCDFVGVNLHKWVGAPIGCGVVYINKPRIADIDTYMAKSPGSTDISARIDTGTSNFAAHMAIPYAIDFHNKIGTAAKEGRLRYLRNLWVGPAREMKGLTVLTPDDPKMVAALTSFRLDGVISTKANEALMKHLNEKFGILTVRRTGPDAGDCIRVTPSVYNTPDDMAKLVSALRSITSSAYSF
ncbi:MAG TPA: aminotransferase class V-fold PLP-dependent enzyme [Pyrinomonadaceae bacterium]|nr:aminotransferase class V-fold PLP-dependent enzyme [Pyrinomonadaceae bacterium]